MHFLLNFNDNQFNIQVRARDYYSFVTLTLLAMGLLFQIPMAILAVTRLGIMTPQAAAAVAPLRLSRDRGRWPRCCRRVDPVTHAASRWCR